VAELKLIRNIYIPELVFRLHDALVESGTYVVTLVLFLARVDRDPRKDSHLHNEDGKRFNTDLGHFDLRSTAEI
jgi:hypothetical protein